MAREVIDMTTSKNAAEVDALVSTYMTDEGFRRTAYGQEEAWKKGHGFSMPQFLTARVADGNVHIEAWLKYPILPGVYVGGELGMTGKMGFAMKKKLKDRVEHLEQILRYSSTGFRCVSANPASSALRSIGGVCRKGVSATESKEH